MWKLVVLAVVAGSLTAAPVPKELKKQDDPTRLRGAWTTETVNVSGQPWEDYSLHTLCFEDDGSLRAKYSKNIADATWTLKLDPKAEPKRMTWTSNDGKNDGYECAYAFVGDQLVVSISHDKRKPPPSVHPGPSVTVYHFNRTPAK